MSRDKQGKRKVYREKVCGEMMWKKSGCETSLSFRRSRSLDAAGCPGDSGQKRKAGKVFGSLERGLDKVITMLTPNKRKGLRDGPRRVKVWSRVFSFLVYSVHHLVFVSFFLPSFY